MDDIALAQKGLLITVRQIDAKTPFCGTRAPGVRRNAVNYVLIVGDPRGDLKLIEERLTQDLGDSSFVVRSISEAEIEFTELIKPNVVVLLLFKKSPSIYRFIAICLMRKLEVLVEVVKDSDSHSFERVKDFKLITEPLEPKN